MNQPIMDKHFTHKTTYLSWVMVFIGAAFYFYEFVLQVSPNVMGPELAASFHVNYASLGNLAAFYFYTYAAMQIPVGILLDRLGPRRMLLFATAICMLGSLMFGATTHLSLAQAARALMGVGSAFAVVSGLKLVANWFPPTRFALLTGLFVMVGMLGAAAGQAPLSLLSSHLAWRDTMLLLGSVGGILFIVIWLVVQDRPASMKDKFPKENGHSHIISDLKNLLSCRYNWITSLYGCLMYAPSTALGALWGGSFMALSLHTTKTTGDSLITFMFLGWMVGSLLFGFISDAIRRRKPPLYLGSAGALICSLFIVYCAHLTPWTMGILIFLFGLFSSGFLPAFSIIRETNHPDRCATGLGFINMLNMAGGAAIQPVIGLILDYAIQHHHGSAVDELSAFRIALTAIPIAILIALLIIPFIRETRCEFQPMGAPEKYEKA